MADKGPSGLTAGSAPDGSEIAHFIQGGNSRKLTIDDILAVAHAHTIADVTGLQAALDAKIDDSQAGAGGLSVLGAANASAVRTAAGVVIGTDVQAFDQQLSDIAGLSYASNALKVVRVNAGETSFELASSGAGTGDVVGPGSSVAGHPVVFDGTSGKLLKDSGVVNFANGAILTPTATPATNEVGYLGCPQNIQDANYTTVMADSGKHLYHTSASTHTWTIDSNANVAYPIGTILTFINATGGGNVTLAITSDTLRWGSSTGSRTLAANGTATAIKVTSTVWRLTGDGIT